jgi:F-type H+-transporting ATPase subunit b
MDAKEKKIKYAISALLMVGVVVAAGTLYASSGAEHQGGGYSHEKLMDLLYRTLNFIALVVILVKFLSKPISNALGGRRAAIAAQFSDLEEKRILSEKNYKIYEEKLSRIDVEAAKIVSAAVAQAESEKVRILDEAQRAAEDIQRKATMSVQNEMINAKRQLLAAISEQAVGLAEELIKKNLQDADQTKLVEDYLAKVGALK